MILITAAVFPPRLALRLLREVSWDTKISRGQGGFDGSTVNWSIPLRTFDAAFVVRTVTDYVAIEEHFHTVRGRGYAFLLKDPLDFRAEAQNGILIDDGDSPITTYQLAKAYAAGMPYPYVRNITRPKAGAVAIYRLRAGSTVDITGSATISATTGGVTFTGGTVLPGDVLSWSGEFWVPCRYDMDKLPGAIIDKQRGPDGEPWVQCDAISICEVKGL